jgi:hypothetical protein
MPVSVGPFALNDQLLLEAQKMHHECGADNREHLERQGGDRLRDWEGQDEPALSNCLCDQITPRYVRNGDGPASYCAGP